ncbi:MAG: sulfur carrier protein ThiS [Clostridiales bacterium]|nr:sulfur carrier protein ThiS [Clostridiales bacterium]
MIKVNNRDQEFIHGMTIQILLEKNEFTFPGLVIKLNGKVIEDHERAQALIKDFDDVKVIHICHGG